MLMAAFKDDSSSAASNVHSDRLRHNDREHASPWSRVVRGGSESTPAAEEILRHEEPIDRSSPRSVDLDCSSSAGLPGTSVISPPLPQSDGGNNAAREKKSPWSAPANGIAEVESVMGADSWPALSEATKNVVKPSYESLKAVSAPAAASISQKPSASNTNSSSTTNHPRQKTKRAGNNSSGLSPTSESSPREFINRSSNDADQGTRSGVLSPQMQGTNDHQKNHGSSRRGNGGQHHNSTNRRDQDGSAYEWNQRSFGAGRDPHLQHRQQPRNITRAFIQPPPPPLVSSSFIPPHVTALGSPIGYHEIPSPIFYLPTSPHDTMRGMPFVSPPALYFAAPDPHLPIVLAKQIEYYFSPENLCKDSYLRQNMDDEGWVPVSLIANFNRVKVHTNNIQFILDSVRPSLVVEVLGDKIRKRNDWMNWPPLPLPSDSDSLTPRVRSLGLEEGLSPHDSHNISPSTVNAGTPQCETTSSNSANAT